MDVLYFELQNKEEPSADLYTFPYSLVLCTDMVAQSATFSGG